TSCEWHGNVRELENALFRAVILSNGAELTAADFPQISVQQTTDDRRRVVAQTIRPRPDSESRPTQQGFRAGDARAGGHTPATPESSFSTNVIVSTDDSGNVRKLADVEEELIRFALKFYRGQMSQVARKLGI